MLSDGEQPEYQFQEGKYMRVKKLAPGPTGTHTFRPPLKILKRIGPSALRTVKRGMPRSRLHFLKQR
ncbi:hypothetical protein HPB50_000007 [Hyalomma asiaticum]|uniref:Uncharacterized protein n=1 Tax=Hyalomma asiaticum TaxID=266040 RepID=A0ACB7RZC9_HYAAI|nr:hypothetical protein HPB50_000007 [Hyalomma asiaticum]